MFGGISFDEALEKFRERVRLMSDAEIIRQGEACRSLCDPKSPSDVWVQQLRILQEDRAFGWHVDSLKCCNHVIA